MHGRSDQMASILLIHSVLGLRPIERDLATEWRGAGHAVTLPDLFEGRTAETYDAGFAILREIGIETARDRARTVVAGLPPDTVLTGISMGAGIAAELWRGRPDAAGILFLAGPAPWPSSAPGTPVQVHAARPEPFDRESVFAAFEAGNPGAVLQMFRYDGVGHFFLDPSLPDHDAAAAALCRARCRDFLASL